MVKCKLFIYFFKINFKKNLSYRANFYLTLIDSICWFVLTLFFYESIYGNISSIAGIEESYIFLIVGTSELIKSLLFTFFIDNLPYIPGKVMAGTLDQYLLYPVDSQFMISFQTIDFGNLANVFPAMVLIAKALRELNISISLVNILAYLFFIAMSFLLGYAIWFIIMTLSVWFTKLDGIHELFLSFLGLSQYPKKVFINKFAPKVMFLFLPFLLMSTVSSEVLLGNIKSKDSLLLPFFSVLFFVISKIFWKKSLEHYSSASS